MFWIKNTIKNVTSEVPVLMTNCQVSEYPKCGPSIPQTAIVDAAAIKHHGVPLTLAVRRANLRKESRIDGSAASMPL